MTRLRRLELYISSIIFICSSASSSCCMKEGEQEYAKYVKKVKDRQGERRKRVRRRVKMKNKVKKYTAGNKKER